MAFARIETCKLPSWRSTVAALAVALASNLPAAAADSPHPADATIEAPQTAAQPQGGMTPGTGPNAVVAPVQPQAPVIAAKTLFGAAQAPAAMEARAIGYYSRGCLAGARQLPVDGPEWQAMRLSRNRNWGHPALVSFLERFGEDARRYAGWPGLLVGDMSQPRGGPMLTGHASHQVGLDADIWFTAMPEHRLSRQEREDLSAVNMLAPGGLEVDPKVFGEANILLLKRAAGFGEVERIFVHPAIKKAVCAATVHDVERAWLFKIRPMWGHDYHFHVRIACPAGTVGCQSQAVVQADDGCGKELDDWFKLLTAPPKPPVPPSPPAPPLTLDKLPAECRAVLAAGRPAAQPVKSASP